MMKKLFMVVATSYAISSPTFAATPAQAASDLKKFLDQVPGLGPGYAVIVVDKNGTVLEYARGERNAQTRAPLTVDTPMYIASQTKAYIGLLAQSLDQQGVLKLNSTLGDQWPDLKLPGGLDPYEWTMSDLLNHKVPISAEAITNLESYIGSPDSSRYPEFIERLSRTRSAGFEYDNLGYNIYAAILHEKTGKKWQDWLNQELIVPLGLSQTSARTSDFLPADIAYGHTWLGSEKGWQVIAPKPDSIMQSAGGIMTSPRDMASWLKLQLGGLDNPSIRRSLVTAAHDRYATQNPRDPNPYELSCDGYAYGWNTCTYMGKLLYVHGGTYTGTRSIMAFSNDLGVGIAAFSNSDNATGWLTSRTVVQYLQFLLDDPNAENMASSRKAMYVKRTAQQIEALDRQILENKNKPVWAGWTWVPKKRERAQYLGIYKSSILGTDAVVSERNSGMQLRIGAMQRLLTPAARDIFGATGEGNVVPQEVTFTRSSDGAIQGFTFQDVTYQLDKNLDP